MIFATWWWLWVMVMFVCLVPPVGYGWAYRGWGPPYPSYLQHQRRLRADPVTVSAGYDHYAWGWGGDFVWLAMLLGAIWAVSSLYWK